MRRQSIQDIVDLLLVMQAGMTARAQPVQEVVTERVVGKQAVDIAADDPPVLGDGTIRALGQVQKGPVQRWSPSSPDMHFVAADGKAASALDAADLQERLFRAQRCLDVKPAQARGRRRRSLDAIGIAQRLAEHLKAAAETEHRAAPSDMGVEIDIEAGRAKRFEIGQGGLGAGEEHQIGIARQGRARLDEHDLDIRFGRKRIEIVEIRQSRQSRHDDLDGGGGTATSDDFEIEDVFGGEAGRLFEPGHDAQRRHPGALLDDGVGVVEEGGIAAEFIDDVAL